MENNASVASDAGFLERLPSEFNLFEDEPPGVVLTLKPIVKNASYELTLKHSELFGLNATDIVLKKSLRGRASEKHCIQIEAKLPTKVIAKNLCFYIMARVKGPIIYWPRQNSVLKFKEV